MVRAGRYGHTYMNTKSTSIVADAEMLSLGLASSGLAVLGKAEAKKPQSQKAFVTEPLASGISVSHGRSKGYCRSTCHCKAGRTTAHVAKPPFSKEEPCRPLRALQFE